MYLDIDASTRDVDRLIRDIIDRVESPAPALEQLGVLIEDYEREVFDTAGGGTWPALSPETVRIKGHSRPLVETGGLLAALTNARVEDDSVAVVAPPYARYPAKRRNPTPTPSGDVVRGWAEMLAEYFVEGRA